MGAIIGGGGLPTSTTAQLVTPANAASSSTIVLPGQQGIEVVAMIGDSNMLGFSAGTENAGGQRRQFNRDMFFAGKKYRMLGRGYGAPNGAGTTWGVFPIPDDFHDAWQPVLRDWRTNSYYGRQVSQSGTITGISGNTITCPSHGLGDGSPVAISVAQGGTLPTITNAPPVTWNGNQYIVGYSINSTTNTFQLSLYEFGSALTITAPGSGTMTAGMGLTEIMGPVSVLEWDMQPTLAIISGATNDISILVAQGAQNVTQTVQARIDAYLTRLDLILPTRCTRIVYGIRPFVAPATNATTCNAIRNSINAYFASVVPARGSKWAYVDPTSYTTVSATVIDDITTAQMASDGIHTDSAGDRISGNIGARAVVGASPIAAAQDQRPRELVRRPQQPAVLLSATSHNIRWTADAARRNPGSGNFFFADSFYPLTFPGGTNAVVQQENPYSSGCLLALSSGKFELAWKSGSFCIPLSNYTQAAKRFRWHRIFCFFDRNRVVNGVSRPMAGLWVNGNLVQIVELSSAAAITSSTGWYLGGSSLSSALGFHKQCYIGVNSGLTIEDAGFVAEQDYWEGRDAPGVTDKFKIDEGSGTSIASTVNGAVAGTLTGGSWIAAGQYACPWEQGYIKPTREVYPGTISATYTAVIDEDLYYDGTATAFAITLPDARGNEGRTISYAELTGGTNNVTLTPSNSQTIDGNSTLVLSTAGKRGAIQSRLGNWSTIR